MSESERERETFAAWLRKAGLDDRRFIDVRDGEKGTRTRGHQKPENWHDSQGVSGNYGVHPGPGRDESAKWLVEFDIDDYDQERDRSTPDALPETFAVKSPHTDPDDPGHLYFAATREVVSVLEDTTGTMNPEPEWGEIKTKGKYVVGPGSQLDGCKKEWCGDCSESDSGYYRIARDVPIAELSREQIADVLAADPNYGDAQHDADEGTGSLYEGIDEHSGGEWDGDEWLYGEYLDDALAHIDPDLPRPKWETICNALCAHLPDGEGEKLALQWSKKGTKYDDDAEDYIESFAADTDGRTDGEDRAGPGTIIGFAKAPDGYGEWDSKAAYREATDPLAGIDDPATHAENAVSDALDVFDGRGDPTPRERGDALEALTNSLAEAAEAGLSDSRLRDNMDYFVERSGKGIQQLKDDVASAREKIQAERATGGNRQPFDRVLDERLIGGEIVRSTDSNQNTLYIWRFSPRESDAENGATPFTIETEKTHKGHTHNNWSAFRSLYDDRTPFGEPMPTKPTPPNRGGEEWSTFVDDLRLDRFDDEPRIVPGPRAEGLDALRREVQRRIGVWGDECELTGSGNFGEVWINANPNDTEPTEVWVSNKVPRNIVEYADGLTMRGLQVQAEAEGLKLDGRAGIADEYHYPSWKQPRAWVLDYGALKDHNGHPYRYARDTETAEDVMFESEERRIERIKQRGDVPTGDRPDLEPTPVTTDMIRAAILTALDDGEERTDGFDIGEGVSEQDLAPDVNREIESAIMVSWDRIDDALDSLLDDEEIETVDSDNRTATLYRLAGEIRRKTHQVGVSD